MIINSIKLNMTLHNKTLLIITIVVAVMLLFMYGAFQIVLMGSFDKMDEQYSLENVEIVKNTLNENINKIDSTTGNRAVWDEGSIYVNDSNEYLNRNGELNFKLNLEG